MANQVYFPHYKQIFDADPAAFILISHPETGLAYKIRVDALQEALTSSLISTDSGNGIIVGDDELLFGKNLYNYDGSLTATREVDLNGKALSFTGGFTVAIDADTSLTFTIADVTNTAKYLTTPNDITFFVTRELNDDTGKIIINENQVLITSNPSNVQNNSVRLIDGTGVAIASVSDNISLTVTSGNAINLAIPAGAELQISGSAGSAENALQSNGAGNPPSWKKIKYAHPFVIADWGAGTKLTITAATHGLGVGYHNVTVFDATHNIVPIAAVLTNVNVDGTSGDVVLTIVNNAAAFAGFAYITV